MAFGILFLALWSYDNQDFLNTMNEQLAQGY